ncbi:F-box-like protein [Ceratobasidium sp. AG-Ba]|nr:F-box-like protein [Ceratobasidium sp. AG-Ba]QRW11017.1 F-box-like protein [Ceratobasidium sp. AG-Ba]
MSVLPAQFDFNTLPDAATRSSMCTGISHHESTIASVDDKIAALEGILAKLMAETRAQVNALAAEKNALEKRVESAKGYLAPVRKLPADILADIFLMLFESDPLVAWKLSAVNRQWRTTALTTPLLWSKIRIQPPAMPTGNAVRLWVERSGNSCPLDIEISLAPPANWQPSTTISRADREAQRDEVQWGHVVMSHLGSQVHRWRRFVYRAERLFMFLGALNVAFGGGSAPLLEEFVVDCGDVGHHHVSSDPWCYLPTSTTCTVPSMKALDLRNVPFTWNSPMLRGLDRLALADQSHPVASASRLSVDRLLTVLSKNPDLEELSLELRCAPAILPPKSLTLRKLKSLTIAGGDAHTLEFLEHLTLPALTTLSVRLSVPEPVDDALQSLLTRSGNPPIKRFACHPAYADEFPSRAVAALPGITHLEMLEMMPRDVLVQLTPSSNDSGSPSPHPHPHTIAGLPTPGVLCPQLESVVIKGCPSLAQALPELVQFILHRNPYEIGQEQERKKGGGMPELKSLVITDCVPLEEDVRAWICARVPHVVLDPPAA